MIKNNKTKITKIKRLVFKKKLKSSRNNFKNKYLHNNKLLKINHKLKIMTLV